MSGRLDVLTIFRDWCNLILPLIDYGSYTWGSTSKLNIERLSKLQKRAARIILKADFDAPSSEMFNELGWWTIANRHNYNKAVLTFKALNDLTPKYITNLLKPHLKLIIAICGQRQMAPCLCQDLDPPSLTDHFLQLHQSYGIRCQRKSSLHLPLRILNSWLKLIL